VAAAAADAGYVAALSTQWGFSRPSTPPYALKRLEIGGEDSFMRFLRTVYVSETEKRLKKALRR